MPVSVYDSSEVQKGDTYDTGKEVDVNLSSKNTSELRLEQFLDERTKIVIVIAQIDDSKDNEIVAKITSLARNEDILSIVINLGPFTRVELKEDTKTYINSDLQHTYYHAILTIDGTKVDEVYGDLPYNEQNKKRDEIISHTIINVINNCFIGSGANMDDENLPYIATIQKVLSNGGYVYAGYGTATGIDRAYRAAEEALKSPLILHNEISGAQNISLVISAGKVEVSLDEIGIINDFIQEATGYCSTIYMTINDDLKLNDALSVNILAIGF